MNCAIRLACSMILKIAHAACLPACLDALTERRGAVLDTDKIGGNTQDHEQ